MKSLKKTVRSMLLFHDSFTTKLHEEMYSQMKNIC